MRALTKKQQKICIEYLKTEKTIKPNWELYNKLEEINDFETICQHTERFLSDYYSRYMNYDFTMKEGK